MSTLHIQATLHRRVSKNRLAPVWTRRYARIETATAKAMEYLMFAGAVGDVIEFHLRRNSMQVGTIRMMASGKVDIIWNTTEAMRLKSEHILKRGQKTTESVESFIGKAQRIYQAHEVQALVNTKH